MRHALLGAVIGSSCRTAVRHSMFCARDVPCVAAPDRAIWVRGTGTKSMSFTRAPGSDRG